MAELIYRPIGVDPEREARLLRDLCSSDGIDDAILSEFPRTIDTFTIQPLGESVARIMNRYVGDNPLAVGNVIMNENVAIGLAYFGLADYREENDTHETSGINVSSWLSSHHRRRGFGRDIIAHTTNQAKEYSSDNQNWHEKQIWTSIRLGNLASTRACESAGFRYTGAIYGEPNRSLYLHDQVDKFEML